MPGYASVETFDPFAEHQWPQKGMQGSFMSNDSDDFVKPLGTAQDEIVQQLKKANSALSTQQTKGLGVHLKERSKRKKVRKTVKVGGVPENEAKP